MTVKDEASTSGEQETAEESLDDLCVQGTIVIPVWPLRKQADAVVRGKILDIKLAQLRIALREEFLEAHGIEVP